MTKALLQFEAERLRDNRWAIRPSGSVGGCGFHPYPWTAIFVNARNDAEALRKAQPWIAEQESTARAIFAEENRQ